MILTIEIGNSTITLGGVEESDISFECRINTDRVKTSDTYCIDLKTLFEIYGIDMASIEGVIISSVVPQVLNSVRTAIRKLLNTEPLVVGPGLKTGLNIQIENPAQTGADLVASAVAALQEHEAPLIIVDMSSTTTMSVLDKNGTLIGGSIGPGVKMSLDALTDRTALLPGLQLDQPKKVIGRNTTDCMRSGVMLGAACMVDGMVERMEQELGYRATVIATGGIARFIVPMCRREIIYDKDLLVKGLAALYRENTRS